jgi:hypothetical protein
VLLRPSLSALLERPDLTLLEPLDELVLAERAGDGVEAEHRRREEGAVRLRCKITR